VGTCQGSVELGLLLEFCKLPGTQHPAQLIHHLHSKQTLQQG
jgi:hypothetical protein